MTERTIYLDPGQRTSHSRSIRVRAARWYATVVLDRDWYVDATTPRGQDAELPAAYTDAVNTARDTAIDRIWYDGYPSGFSWGSGPRSVMLFVPFPHVEATVEALRVAELDHDYSRLHELAGSLVLPVDGWLAPGERELVRGVDFDTPPGAFLRFLRVKAKQRGVRLNGRSTAGSVWVRPTLPSAEKQRREGKPEQYPGWVDRWTGYVESDDAPMRPWVGGRDQNLSHGAVPVEFRFVNTPTGGTCACGMNLREACDDGKEHTAHHAEWAFGVRAPKNLEWWGDLAVVTTQSRIAWRKLAHQVARKPQKENHYDFNSWFHLGEPEKTPDHVRAYLMQANGYVIGYVSAHDTSQHRHWDFLDGSRYGDRDDTLRPSIDLVWVADTYRRQGVGATLVQALADDFGCQVSDVSWSHPVSEAGQHLARRVSREGFWVN